MSPGIQHPEHQTITEQYLQANWPDFKQEEILFPGFIQSYGVLLVLEEPQLTIIQTSANTSEYLGISPEILLQKELSEIFPKSQMTKLKEVIEKDDFESMNFIKFSIKKGKTYASFDGVIHRNPDSLLILELEPSLSPSTFNFLGFYHHIRATARKFKKTQNLEEMCQFVTDNIRQITGFDRVMTYKFAADWSGSVIAESKRADLTPFLGLHFPEIDTQPCRHLYDLNSIRVTPDINAESVALFPVITPTTNKPLDLSYAGLRGLAPCHQQFMQNLGIQSNLVLSLFQQQQLWGMITCHHYSYKQVPYELRQACEFLSHVMSTEIYAKESLKDYDDRVMLKSVQDKLTEYMSKTDNFVEGLVAYQPNLLDLCHAQGAVLCWGDQRTVIGQVPSDSQLDLLIDWLNTDVSDDIFWTNALSNEYPPAAQYRNVAAGLLTITISTQNRILWFRPEVVQTVKWAGDPTPVIEPADAEGTLKLSPRESFELWEEMVLYRSLPWLESEIDAAREFKGLLVNLVLRQADELVQLAKELERSNTELEKFAYVASHDLKEPLNLVSSYVQLLETRYRDQLDHDGKEFIGFAVEGVNHMQMLIDDLLAYSRLGSQGEDFEPMEIETALSRACTNLQGRIEASGAVITHDPLPRVVADHTQLTQLFQNFIGNAIKFRSAQIPNIHIGVVSQGNYWQFSVRDNGIGIDPKFAERIFLIFQQLHTRDMYEGTGIGLAICKKIVERHRGQIWVESAPGEGSTFYFTLPMQAPSSSRGSA